VPVSVLVLHGLLLLFAGLVRLHLTLAVYIRLSHRVHRRSVSHRRCLHHSCSETATINHTVCKNTNKAYTKSKKTITFSHLQRQQQMRLADCLPSQHPVGRMVLDDRLPTTKQ
jgi:hypothetical protein